MGHTYRGSLSIGSFRRRYWPTIMLSTKVPDCATPHKYIADSLMRAFISLFELTRSSRSGNNYSEIILYWAWLLYADKRLDLHTRSMTNCALQAHWIVMRLPPLLSSLIRILPGIQWFLSGLTSIGKDIASSGAIQSKLRILTFPDIDWQPLRFRRRCLIKFFTEILCWAHDSFYALMSA